MFDGLGFNGEGNGLGEQGLNGLDRDSSSSFGNMPIVGGRWMPDSQTCDGVRYLSLRVGSNGDGVQDKPFDTPRKLEESAGAETICPISILNDGPGSSSTISSSFERPFFALPSISSTSFFDRPRFRGRFVPGGALRFTVQYDP